MTRKKLIWEEEEAVGPKATPYNQYQGRRRQGVGSRVWLVVEDTGDYRLDEVSKHQIMHRTGLPARDLRALDPVLSYPSSILGRERAIVVNLEHIKAIITANQVLMVNSSNPLVVDFVDDLRHWIVGASRQAKESGDPYKEGGGKSSTWSTPASDYHHTPTQPLLMNKKSGGVGRSMDALNAAIGGSPGSNTVQDESNTDSSGGGPKSLPFEFRALEACLESACRCFESETRTLEQEAYPALDELTSQICTLNLERVRQIKSRLVAISGRVQKVRDEVEHLLDDDHDMAEMYLTEKLTQYMKQVSMRIEPENDPVHHFDDDEMEDDEDSKSHSHRFSDAFTSVNKPNIEELEMLLEAYFAQIDGISQKLSTMSEYVGDTEDYINIMLDDKQNQLLQMGVMLSTANMIINAGIVVVGLFGMNIHISLFDGENRQFWEAALGTVGSCICLYLVALGWGRKRYLLSL